MAKVRKKVVATDDERELRELADLAMETMQLAHHSDLESVETYTQRVRDRIHRDIKAFRRRFTHGYQVLLQELELELDKHKDV